MKLSLIITRLKNNVPLLNKKVEGLLQLSDIDNAGARRAGAFVLPLKEDAQANQASTQVVVQRITETFGVVVGVKTVRDLRGEAAHDGGLSSIKDELLQAMVGWVPVVDYSQFEYVGGQLLKINGGTVYWVYNFKVWHIEER